MATVGKSRRERLREETSAEIRAVALDLLTRRGPDAIALRAIAREMGMSAGALYGYFDTRDALVTAVVEEVFASLLHAVRSARDSRPADDPRGRLLAWAEAFRTWAVAHPGGFRLIYGDAVPGYRQPAGGAAAEAKHSVCSDLIGLAAAAWPYARSRPITEHSSSLVDPELLEQTRSQFPDLPPAGVLLAVRMWARMHGLVSLEVYGHVNALIADPADLYRAEMHELAAALGLDRPA